MCQFSSSLITFDVGIHDLQIVSVEKVTAKCLAFPSESCEWKIYWMNANADGSAY